jgi:hypothetical protein
MNKRNFIASISLAHGRWQNCAAGGTRAPGGSDPEPDAGFGHRAPARPGLGHTCGPRPGVRALV